MVIILIDIFFMVANCSKAIFHPLIEKYLRNRKKKQIANKIKVISKLNPFYQEEKRTCY